MKLSRFLLVISKNGTSIGVDTTKRLLNLGSDIILSEYDECAVMMPTLYDRICNRKTDDDNKKIDVNKYIKVTYQGNSIYRLCRGEIANGLNKDHIALTSASIRKLRATGDHRIDSITVEVTQSWWYWFPFYWYHPFHATRIAMRVGILSLIAGVASIILFALDKFNII